MIEDNPILLIVDDELSCRETFRIALEDEYHLIEAETGEQALNIVKVRQDIDLVFLDYLLPPGMDGLEVLERMKELKYEIPVIIVTGKGSEEVAVKAFKFGAKDYIIKPFKVQNLRAAIEEILGLTELGKCLVDKAIKFMKKNYFQPISAKDVAKAIGVSYSHLAYLFKMEKGCSIIFWLNKLRIEKAKVLLHYSGLEIKEIAAQVGFRSQQYFCKVFKMYLRFTPSEYKTKCRS